MAVVDDEQLSDDEELCEDADTARRGDEGMVARDEVVRVERG